MNGAIEWALGAARELLVPPALLPRTAESALALSIAGLLLVSGPGALLPFAFGAVIGALRPGRWEAGRAAGLGALALALAVGVTVGVVLLAWSFTLFDLTVPMGGARATDR